MFPLSLDCAAESGVLECVSSLLDSGVTTLGDRLHRDTTMQCAARSGCVEVVRLLRERGCVTGEWEVHEAAARGHAELLRYLCTECREMLAPVDTLDLFGDFRQGITACAEAAREGQLECLRIARENGALWLPIELQGFAGDSGRLDVLEYLEDSGVEWSAKTCASLARGGHLDLLRKFHEELGVPWDSETCRLAASSGHLDVLKYAHENGCPWNADLMCSCASSRECLEYCLEQGCEFPVADDASFVTAHPCVEMLRFSRECGCWWCAPRCLFLAAAGDRLDVVRYLHEIGCPMTEDTARAAAAHLRILRYCHERGCPWDERTCLSAAENRSSASCLAYARSRGCPWSASVIEMAAKSGSVVCFRYCLEHGLPWTQAVSSAVLKGDCAIFLQVALSLGCQMGADFMEQAVKHGSLSCFLFGLQNGLPWDWQSKACRHPNLRQWVEEGRVHEPASLFQSSCWPLPIHEFFDVVESHDMLCCHDVAAMRLSCASWNSLCAPFVLDCALHSEVECSVARGWHGRLASQLSLSSPGSSKVHLLSRTCGGRGSCGAERYEEHLRCLKTLLRKRPFFSHLDPDFMTSPSRVISLPVHWRCLVLVAAECGSHMSCGHLFGICSGGIGAIPEVEKVMMESVRIECADRSPFLNAVALLREASRTGSLACTRFLAGRVQKRNQNSGDVACLDAVEGGNIEVLEFVKSSFGLSCLTESAVKAATLGNVKMLRFLFDQGTPLCEACTEAAAASGQLDCLRLLHESGCALGPLCVLHALKCGDAECLEYCLKNGAPSPDWHKAWMAAMVGGSKECLDILISRGHCEPLTESDLCRAVSSGSVEALRLLRGLPVDVPEARVWSAELCRAAAESGKLRCLRYLHETGIPWDSRTCEAAESKGNVACLRYACEHGCPWDPEALKQALKSGHYSCLNYIRAHRITFVLPRTKPQLVRESWNTNWPLPVCEFLDLVDSLKLLCSHDLCAMRLSCKTWKSRLHGSASSLPKCSLGSAVACAAANGWFGRLSSCLPAHHGPPIPLSRLCHWSSSLTPSRMSDHVRCVKLVLSRKGCVDTEGYHHFKTSQTVDRHWECMRAVAVHEHLRYRVVAPDCDAGLGRIPKIEDLLLKTLRRDVLSPGFRFASRDLSLAADSGSLACVEFIVDKVAYIPIETWESAARGGNVEILRLLEKFTGISCPPSVVVTAAKWGRLDVLRHILARSGAPALPDCCFAAAKAGHLDCLRFLHESGCGFGAKCVDKTIKGGYPDCLRYCLEHRAPRPSSVQMWRAVLRTGSADCLQVLVDLGHSHAVTLQDVVSAVTQGHLALVDLLCDISVGDVGMRGAMKVCRTAAAAGHVRCLRYLHETGWPWDSTVCQVAAQRGHLPCLRYAHEQNCPWTAIRTPAWAKTPGQVACAQYMTSHGL